MTKKDYELIAASFKQVLDNYRSPSPHKTPGQYDDHIIAIEEMAQDLAYDLAMHDNRFKHNRFLKACGVSPAAIKEYGEID